MTQEELNIILEKHNKWLRGEDGGERANLTGANLTHANLTDANLTRAKNIPFIPTCCPDSGSFVGWKKAHAKIVKLLIPEDAERLSAAGRKCRCNKAVVIAIENLDGRESGLNEVPSDYDCDFIYKIGETVSVAYFDKYRFNECSTGIHFFINRQEAVNY